MVESIKKSDINLKRSDMANMFNAYFDENGDSVFYMGRTLEFGNLTQLNEKYVIKHIWKDEDTWYKLAYQYYSDSKLWWIIAKANEIKNPFNIPDVGTNVNVPNESIINIVLDRIASQ
jgi:nucleoid-associated protein YgaU